MGCRRSLRIVRAAFGLVLLACAALTALPGTAWAQTELWSATLTVGKWTQGGIDLLYGFVDLATDVGALTDTTFTYDNTDYSIEQLSVGILNPGLLAFKLDPLGTTEFNSSDFTLHIGTEEFSLGDATASNTGFQWSNSGLSWSVINTINVKLTKAAADTTGPAFDSAEVPATGDSLVITFDEDLDEDTAHKPAASRFTVEANNTEITVDSFTVLGKTVTLSLRGTVTSGQTVTVSYEDPGSGDDTRAIQDGNGNDAPSFTDESVTNNSTQTSPMTPATCTGTVVWSAAMTVANGTGGFSPFTGLLNLAVGDSNFGSLTDTTFTLDDTDYVIRHLYIQDQNNRLFLGLDPVGEDAFGSDHTLCIGSDPFSFGDATFTAGVFRWSNSGLSWSNGDRITVNIVKAGGSNPTSPVVCEATDLLCAAMEVGHHWTPFERCGSANSICYPAEAQRGFYDFNSNYQDRFGSLSSQTFEIGDKTFKLLEFVYHRFHWARYPRDNYVSLSFSRVLPPGRYTLEIRGWRKTIRGGQRTYTFKPGDMSLWSRGSTFTVRLVGPDDIDTHVNSVLVEGNEARSIKPVYRTGVGPSHVFRANVDEDVSPVTVVVEPRDPDATVAFQGYGTWSGVPLCDASSSDDGFQVHVKRGFITEVLAKVTAADGRTVQTYSLGIISGDTNKIWAAKPQRLDTGCGAQMAEGASEPLTASLESAPERHDGSSAFTVRIAFSEALKNQALGAKVVSVSGGTHAGSRRIAGDDEIWEITVEPSGDDDVILQMVASDDCGSGIACTASFDPLSANWSTTIPGPEAETVTPLTASFADIPDEHDGSAFPVRIAFSETLKNQALGARVVTVTGGTNTRSRRVGSGTEIWEVTIEPSGTGDISISLAASETCGSGIACTSGDHRPLSQGLSHTVMGPAAISVADATATEGTDATIDFVVRLSRRAIGPVSVDYATANGTATAGADYTAKQGTLRFTPGQQSKTVRVAVLQDSHEDDGETFTLTLSNPVNAIIADGTATGTIENSDAMPQAWLARFGRTVAEQVLNAVEGRMRASRTAGVEMTLAGRALPSWRPGHGADGDPDGVTGGTPAGSPASSARQREAQAQQAADARLAAWLGDGTDPARPRGPEARAVSPRDLLTGSSFALTGGEARAGFYSLWGRAAVSRFDGREGALSLDGDVATGFLGADWSRDRVAAGLVVGHSRGEGGYRAEAGDGAVESTLTGVYPWGRYAVSERVSVWGVAGYGEGTLTLTPEGQPAIRADLGLALGAAGLRGVLLAAPAGGGFELAVKADALAVRTTTARAPGLGAAAADATRLQLGLEGARPITFAGGATLTPSVEVGVRQDGGDAETGFGVDLGGGLAWRDPARGLSADLRGRGLLSHEADGIRELGFSGALGWEPAASDGQGPKLTIRQSVGASAAGGMDALLGRRTLAGLAPRADGDDLARRRFELRFGYGFAAFGHRFTSTPELALGRTDGSRDVGLGWRLGLTRGAGALELRLEATRREAAGGTASGAAPEHALGVRATARW